MNINQAIEMLEKIRAQIGNAQVVFMDECPEHGMEFIVPTAIAPIGMPSEDSRYETPVCAFTFDDLPGLDNEGPPPVMRLVKS